MTRTNRDRNSARKSATKKMPRDYIAFSDFASEARSRVICLRLAIEGMEATTPRHREALLRLADQVITDQDMLCGGIEAMRADLGK